MATVWSWLDDEAPQSGWQLAVPAPADGSFDGLHTLTWYAVDNAGNREAPQTAVLRIDTTGPTTIGKNVTAFTGHAVKLRYEVLDALSPQVSAVELRTDRQPWQGRAARRAGRQERERLVLRALDANATGAYRYAVSAHDLAGNAQRTATPAGSW